MAEIIGCMAMSHGPQLLLKPDQWGLLNTRSWDPLPERPELKKETLDVKWTKWSRCQAAIDILRYKLEELTPDVVIIVGDDQHENILEDNTPPFTIFTGKEFEASVSLRYLKQSRTENRTRYKVNTDMAMAITNTLMEMDFDPAYSQKTRYEGGMGHAFARVLKFLMPDHQYPVIPIMVNTYYPPAPSAKRCVQFGKALATAIRQFPEQCRVVIIGSGGIEFHLHKRICDGHGHVCVNFIRSTVFRFCLFEVPQANARLEFLSGEDCKRRCIVLQNILVLVVPHNDHHVWS